MRNSEVRAYLIDVVAGCMAKIAEEPDAKSKYVKEADEAISAWVKAHGGFTAGGDKLIKRLTDILVFWQDKAVEKDTYFPFTDKPVTN